MCELLFERLLPEQNRPGEYKFLDFTRDEKKMNAIFESFLLNFYRHECAQDYPIVKRSIIHFQLTALEADDEDILPEMITDVTLDNPEAGKRIILDAKYYKEMLSARFETAKKLRRSVLRGRFFPGERISGRICVPLCASGLLGLHGRGLY